MRPKLRSDSAPLSPPPPPETVPALSSLTAKRSLPYLLVHNLTDQLTVMCSTRGKRRLITSYFNDVKSSLILLRTDLISWSMPSKKKFRKIRYNTHLSIKSFFLPSSFAFLFLSSSLVLEDSSPPPPPEA